MKKYSKVTLPAGIIIVKRLTPSTRLATINDDDNRNGENCLKAIYGTSTKLEFAYDYNGRRFNKKVYAKSGGNWVLSRESLFVYDNFKQIAEFTVSGGAKTLAKSYVWQPEASGDFDVPLWQKVGGNVYTCVVDGNKNVRRLLNTAGTEVANYDYDPFGGVTASGTASAGNPFRFSSEFLDEETGLVYYNYRYYSPALGRWISRDPIEEQGGVNLYGFLGNDDLSHYDILGYEWTVNRNGNQWADATRTLLETDTIEKLASIVQLNATEFKYWLKNIDYTPVSDEDIKSKCQFLVPNSFAIATAKTLISTNLVLTYWSMRLSDALERRGFFVIMMREDVGFSREDIVREFHADYTWGYAVFGHGYRDAWWRGVKTNLNGGFTWNNEDAIIIPGEIRAGKRFKFGLGINYHCYANDADWKSLSITYYGADGMLSALSGPRGIGYWGSWAGLVDSALKNNK